MTFTSGCTDTTLTFSEAGAALMDGQPIQPPHSWPVGVDNWRDEIAQAASEFALPPAFVAAVIAQESAGNPGAGSYAGARGLMQIMPETWNSLMGRAPRTPIPDGERDIPLLNVRMGCKLLSQLQKRYDNNWIKMLATYNRGKVQCGTGKTYPDKKPCPPEAWGVVTNCGYVSGVLGYYNDAMTRGYGPEPAQADTLPPEGGGMKIAAIIAAISALAAWWWMRK